MKLLLVLAAIVLVLTVIATSSVADEVYEPGSSGDEVEVVAPSPGEGSTQPLAFPTDPEAAENLPHTDLSRDAALDLLRGVYGPVLEGPEVVFDGLEAERYYSDHAMVVDGLGEGDQTPSLVESLLPLRTTNDAGEHAPVDLGLMRQGQAIESSNPLVDVELPATLGDGVELPETGIGIELPGLAADRSASLVQDNAAFYPNVAEDADLTVVPTLAGFETLTQLRSAEAPTQQRYDLDLPVGAELRSTADGGASVDQGDAQLLRVHPPSAIDAEGERVPVQLEVDGSTLVVSASPGEHHAYPILVDPVFESYTWTASATSGGLADWVPVTNTPMMETQGITSGFFQGLNIQSYNGSTAVNWPAASWNYYVPRYFADMSNPDRKARPESFIKKMSLSGVYWLIEEPKPYGFNPMIGFGIWDDAKEAYVESGWRSGLNGPITESPNYVYNFENKDQVTNVRRGTIITEGSEYKSRQRHLLVGQATIELGDKDPPVLDGLGGPEKWLNEAAGAPLTYAAKDKALGVLEVQGSIPKRSGGTTVATASGQCIGTVSKPCPYSISSQAKPVTYQPSQMPQGETYVKLVAKDPLGQAASGEVQVRVDHTKPTLAVSGPLTEQAALGTNLPEYKLEYEATDGDSESPTPTSPIFNLGTGPEKMQKPTGVAVDAAGNIWVADRENNRVLKFDKNGAFKLEFGKAGSADGQFNDPRGIAISAKTGNVWVTELGGNRVQEFKPNGEFVKKITAVGSGTFTDPYGIAIGPEGTVWVVDLNGLNVVWMFNESGTLLGYSHGTAAAPTASTLELVDPVGVAVDAEGNAWVTDFNLNRVTQYAKADGRWLSQFGTAGSEKGQLSFPTGIAVGPSGGIFVSDNGNNRIQQFRADGSYMKKFGTNGISLNQFSEIRGVAVDKDGTVLVAENGNQRISRWLHGDYNPQSGVAKVEILVDGISKFVDAPGCANKDCKRIGEWPLKADDYSVGSHKVEVIATDGVELKASPVVLNIETHGDLKAPVIALSGSMTEQGTLGTTRPSYYLDVNATDPGEAGERKSGVASVKVKIDGTEVKSSSPGCPAGGCSLQTQWTLNSLSYSAGTHNVEVIATDAAGRSSSKSLTVNITKDTSAPTITGMTAFYNAPEGWVEQKSYFVKATGQDPAGYGVTSMTLKIDGEVVRSASAPCAEGGCQLVIAPLSPLNMASYGGGAHDAELRVVDGAGNVAKKAWTVNVDPKGAVSTAEAEDTLEAVEETADANLLGETTTETELEGTVEGLEFEEEEGEIFVEGNAAPTYLAADPSEGLTVEVPMDEDLDACLGGGAVEQDLTGEEEEELAEDPPAECPEASMGNTSELELLPAEVTPVSTSANSGETTLLGEDATAVATNVQAHTDLITRPLYDGAMTFAAIRDANAPRVYEWEIKLAPFQELVQIDPQHVQVRYDEDHVAFAITAVPAHDAIGTTVPTSLDIDGDVISLTIDHTSPSPAGGSFVYPVLGGSGWEGGWHSYQIAMPPNELGEEWGEQEQELFESQGIRIMTMGPPEAVSSVDEAGPDGEHVNTKRFKFTMCYPHNIPGDPFDGKLEPPFWVPHHRAGEPDREKNLPHIVSECHREDFEGVYWAVSVTGKFHYVFHKRLRVDQSEWNCNRKWGEEEPAKIQCRRIFFEQPYGPHRWVKGPIYLVGDFRFPPSQGQPQVPDTRVTCMTVGGALYPNPRKAFNEPVERPMIYEKTYPPPIEKCNWPWKAD